MTFKLKKINLILVLLLPVCVFSKNTKQRTTSVNDSLPIITFHTRIGMPDSIVYTSQDGNEINVNCNVEFKGGVDSLNTFCDSLYYNRINYNYHEINENVIYYILFDNNLHIKEIRIHSRLLGYCGKYDYNTLFRKILIQTEGKWLLKTTPSKTWYLYIGSHRFY